MRKKSRKNFQLYPDEPAYAEGFSKESKLEKFLLTSVSEKTSGIFSLLVALSLVLIFSSIFFQPSQINNSAVIQTASTIKTTQIVAGGNPIKWTKLVKRSEINSVQYLLKLPKQAKNIKLKGITEKESKDILQSSPKEQLSFAEKNKLALQNQPKGFFGGGFASIFDSLKRFFTADLAGGVENIINPNQNQIDLSQQATGSNDMYVAVNYETPAPTITEQKTDTGKIVTVSDSGEKEDCGKIGGGSNDSFYQACLARQVPLTDVLASTKIPEIYKVGQESKIKMKWKNEGDKDVTFHAYDTDGNGKLDYVEWTVPHLSDQVFEIIFISKAWHLDSNKEITEDIYDTVKEQDGTFATIPANDYVRATFNDILDNTKDITVHAKPTDPSKPASIKIYSADTNQLVATINNINSENTYRTLLTDLITPTDTFDLKIIGGNLDIDYIVDPVAWLTGWSYRKKITISNTNVDADLSNFPLLVSISADSDMSTALATGYDIRFTDSGGRSTLYYERESWSGGNGSAGTGVFWVNVATISHSANTDIYMYYGKAGATDGQSATNVWDSNFKAVWHLKETGTGAAGDYKDSTINANNSINTTLQPTVSSSGKIGNAQSFGAGTQINMGKKDILYNSSYATWSAWVNPSSLPSNWASIITSWNDAGPSHTWIFDVFQSGFSMFLKTTGNGDYPPEYRNASLGITTSAWQYLTITYDGNAGSNNLKFYINNNQVWQATRSGGSAPIGIGTNDNLKIGVDRDATAPWNGLIDEARISSFARPAEWIKFEYYNQGISGNQLTFASQETLTGGSYVWTDGSGDGKWSTTSNWQGGVVPGVNDIAIFNSAATDNCAIDANVSVAGITISSGYTGTITQNTTKTIAVGASGWTQADGTFTGGDSAVTITGTFTLSGGTFTGGSGTNTFKGDFTHSAGTFTTTSGSTVFNGSSQTIDVPTTDTFNSVEINNTVYWRLSNGDTVVVNGTLTLTNGDIRTPGPIQAATLNAKGAISVAATFAGGYDSATADTYLCKLLIDGASSQSFIIPAGAHMPKTTLNQVSTIITTSGSGTITWDNLLTLTSGTFNAGSVDQIFSGGVTISGGTFTGGSGTNTFKNESAHSTGTFTATTGTTIFSGSVSGMDIPTTETFNNVEFNTTSYFHLYNGDKFVVNGTLTLTDGDVRAYNTSNTATLEANGTISVASTFDGGVDATNNLCTLLIDGTGDQSFVIPAGASMPKTTLNQANTTITTSGSGTVTWDAAVTLTAGALNAGSVAQTFSGGATVGTGTTLTTAGGNLSVTGTFSVTGTLSLQGDETISTPTLNTGSTVEYTATSSSRAIKDWTYTNATLKINGAGGTFTLGGAKTFAAATILAGTFDANGNNPTVTGAFSVTSTLRLQGDETISTPTLNTGSTVEYYATSGSRTIKSWSYKNLTINGSGGTFVGTSALVVGENFTLSAGTFTAGTNTSVAGNWTNNGATFTPGTNTVTFNGTGAQAINGTAASQTFYKISVNKSAGTLSISGSTTALNASSTFTLEATNAGTFDANNQAVTITGLVTISGGTYSSGNGYQIFNNGLAISGGTFTVSSSSSSVSTTTFALSGTGTLNIVAGILSVRDNWLVTGGTFNCGTGRVQFNKTSGEQTLEFQGVSSLLYPFNNFWHAQEGTLKLLSPVFIQGNFNDSSTAGTFNANGQNISVGGNWTFATGTFTPGGNTVTFNGTSAQAINGTATTQTFYNLIVNLTAGQTLSVGGSTTTLNVHDFTETTGNFTPGVNINVSGSWANNGGVFTAGTNTVTLNGASQAISGDTTFYNLTKSVASTDTLTFAAGSTQIISHTLTLNGAASNLLSLVSSSSPTQWKINPQSTRTLSYLSVKDSNNTNATAINMVGTNSTDHGHNTNWLFNVAPNAPTLVSPANASYTNNNKPTFSAHYSDNDTGDTGTTNYRISKLSLTDCMYGDYIASGTSSETASNSADTTWTSDLLGEQDRTYYWCAQNNDGLAMSDWTEMGSFNLDTTPPDNLTINFPVASTKYNTTTYAATPFSWTCADSGSECADTCEVYNNSDVDLGPCLHYTPVADGNYTIKIKESDNTGNQATSSTVSFTYDTTAPSSVSSTADNAWHNSAFNVTLNCTDAISGCDKVYYCTNVYGAPTCTPDTNYVSPGLTFNFATQGEYVLRLKGVDQAGNASTAADETNHLKLDSITPTQSSWSPANNATITTTTPTITFTLSETGDCYAATTDWGYNDMVVNNATDCVENGLNITCQIPDLGLAGTKHIYISCEDYPAINRDTAATNTDLTYILDTIPNVPTLVSPANASYANDNTPTLSAHYLDNDTGDAGTTNYRISTSSLVDCTNNTNVVAWGTSSETSSNSADTTWTNATSIGSDGTYYWCAQNNDGVATSAWTAMGNFILDTQAPATTASAKSDYDGSSYTFGNTTSSSVTVSLSCADSTSGCVATYYCADTTDTCLPNTVYTTPIAINSTKYVRYYSTDSAQNSETISSKLVLTASRGGIFIGTTQTPPPAPTPSIVQQITAIPQQIVQQITNIIAPPVPTSQIVYPPIEQAVPEQAPVALQGWNVMEVKPLSELALTPINSNIGFFSEKIPQLEQALLALGIDVNRLSDVQKIGGVEMYLPGLTQTALTSNQILEINKLAYVQGVPLIDLSTKAQQKIPNDIVFVRDKGELIDYKVAISVDKIGQVMQKINTISGKTIELVIKPDKPARSVTGFLTLKKLAVGKTETNVLGYITHLLTASLVNSVGQNSQKTASSDALLVDKFAYVETAPGIFKASLTAPKAEGEYDISTVINYKDINIAPKETKMTAIVNPEGYVYSQVQGGKLRIEGANVSLMWLNPNKNVYELWPADKFLQKNPVLTDDTGKYSFLVPEGTYKIKAEAHGYSTYESEPFVMKEDIAVNKDIQLFKKTGWFDWLNWQAVIAFLLVVLIGYNFWQNIVKVAALKGRASPEGREQLNNSKKT